jgi:hypothetical protein
VTDARKASYIAMSEKTSGSVILLARDTEGRGWTYKNAMDPRDRGSIADYLQRHERLSPAAALERIVACMDPRRRDSEEAVRYREYRRTKAAALLDAEARHATAVRERADALKVLARAGLHAAAAPEWRIGPLGAGPETIGKILAEPTDLWASRYRPSDRKLVIAERPVDALSYGQARGEQNACYLAVGSELTPRRRTQIAHLLAELPTGMTVVVASGRDRAGHQLATDLQALAPQIKMERAQPELGARWNDEIQLEARHARSLGRNGAGLAR